MAKVKPKPKLPTFEVTEYSFGELDNRQQYGDVDLKLQFEDDFDMNFSISFHEFLDHHKRKKSDLWRHVERIQAKLTGWGTRYFDLLEALSSVSDLDVFAHFGEYIIDMPELTKNYFEIKEVLAGRDKNKRPPAPPPPPPTPEQLAERKRKDEEWEEYIANRNALQNSPYYKDRDQFEILLQEATDAMYEGLKAYTFPQLSYYYRHYPNRFKDFMDTIWYQLGNIEEELMQTFMPEISADSDELYHTYTSHKAEEQDEEPPTAR